MALSDVDVAVAAASAGAAVVARAIGEPAEDEPRLKGAVNPVTEADDLSEAAVLSVIRRERPRDHILAEESGGSGWDRGRVWIVDPLDGTINFLHRIPQVAVSVALWEDGRPRVGVVVDAVRGEVFSAETGHEATLDGKPITVSDTTDPAAALIATGFPYDRQERAEQYTAVLAAVLARFQGIRRFGSAALDICWVAAGRFDGFWEYSLGPWDTAAAIVIATAAGAVVTRPGGEPYGLADDGIVVAGPGIYEELRATVWSRHPR